VADRRRITVESYRCASGRASADQLGVHSGNRGRSIQFGRRFGKLMTDPYGFGNATPPPHGGYGQPGYGQPGYPPPPGPQGYVSYGQGAPPPYIHVPPPMPGDNELRKLDDDGQLWLLVAAAGFWVGFGWITGPLAWYFGSKIRGQYRALGHHPGTSANWAWGLGITTTLIYYVGFALIMMAVMFVIGGRALSM
jgi:catechol 2,3-dioxygenase-like lactoylglutathione lyase family enzyme